MSQGRLDQIRRALTAENIKKIIMHPLKRLASFPGLLVNYKQKHPKTFALFSMTTFLIIGSSLLLHKYQGNLLYFPSVGFGRYNKKNPPLLQHPTNRNLQSDDLQILTKDNVKLKGWHIKNNQAQQIFVFFQGNAGNIGTRLPFIQKFNKITKSQAIIVAYRGYSDSQGVPSQIGLETDSEAILEKAIKLSQQRKLRLYIFGQSLGGAVAIYVAGTQPVKNKLQGVILQNTFTSTSNVLYKLNPFIKAFSPIIGLVNKNNWNSLSRINKIKSSVFFIKSLKDQIVHPSMIDQLRAQCNKHHIHTYLFEIQGATHNDVWMRNSENYFKQINQFISASRGHA